MGKNTILNESSLSVDRPFFMVGLATLPYLFYASMVAIFVVLVRLIGRYRHPCLDRLTQWTVGAIALLLIFSSMAAQNVGEAWLQLANFLPYLLMFAYIPTLLKRMAFLENLAVALVVATVPINIMALGEYILKAPFFPASLQSIPWIETFRNAPHRGRAMVMFDHPNVMASYLTVVLGLALGLFLMQLDYGRVHAQNASAVSKLDHPDTDTEDSQRPCIVLAILGKTALWGGCAAPPHCRWPRPKRYGYSYQSGFSSSSFVPWAIALILIGLFCTGSRNGLAIAVSQLLIFAGLARFDRRIVGAIILLLGLGVVVVATVGLGVRQIGVFNIANDPRMGIWAIALDLIRERPWLGWGLGSFKFLYPPRLIDPEYQDIFHPHNIWLLLGTEAGILVMILMSLLVGFILYRVIRYGWIDKNASKTPSERAIALGYMLAFWGCLGFALFDVTFYDVRVNALNWTILAALYAIPYAMRSSPTPPSPTPPSHTPPSQ